MILPCYNFIVSTYAYWLFMLSLPWLACSSALLTFLLGFYFLVEFLIETFINIIIDSQAIIRNNPERNFVQFPIVVTFCKTAMQHQREEIDYCDSLILFRFPQFCLSFSLCVCTPACAFRYVDIKLWFCFSNGHRFPEVHI